MSAASPHPKPLRIPRRGGVRAIALALALASGLPGCVAPVVEPGGDLSLADDEGLLVVHTWSRWPLRRLDAGVRTIASGIPEGEDFRLVRMPAGRYRWSDAVFQRNAPYYKLSTYRTGAWEFEVRPGVINYPGLLWIGETRLDGGMRTAGMRSVNRSAWASVLLLQKFPEAFQRYEVVFTGFVRDDFLEVYRREKLARESQPPEDATP